LAVVAVEEFESEGSEVIVDERGQGLERAGVPLIPTD
jgi:hypothetical protein